MRAQGDQVVQSTCVVADDLSEQPEEERNGSCARTVRHDHQHAPAPHIDALAQGGIVGPIHTDLPLDDEQLVLTPSGVVSPVRGTIRFLTPIAEMPMTEVTKREAEAYERGYQAGRRTPAGRILVFDESSVYGYGRKPDYFRWVTPLDYRLFAAARDAEVVSLAGQQTPQQPGGGTRMGQRRAGAGAQGGGRPAAGARPGGGQRGQGRAAGTGAAAAQRGSRDTTAR